MEKSDNPTSNFKPLRRGGWILAVFLTLSLVTQLAGCFLHRAPQKLHKVETIKSAPRSDALVKRIVQASPNWQIYLPFMSQMRSANPLTHPDSPPPVARVSSPPSLELSGIDFGNQQDWVRIKIYPTSQQVNDGQPVILKFIPGQRCIFGDNHACVAAFIDNEGTPVIWLTIHSGVGGEGQPFRDAVEGTGIDRAAYSLKKILSNLQALSGSQVVISQGTRTIRDLRLQATARIPGSMLQGYFNTPLENTLDFSTQIAPELHLVSQSTQPIIVFETCGWRVPGQPWFPGTTDTSASVYLGVIQISD
jgi:hypothetical protein